MNIQPPVTWAPTVALLDKDLSDPEYRIISIIALNSGLDGCGLTNATIAGLLGWTVARVRSEVDSLVSDGFLLEEERDKRYLRVVMEKAKPVAPAVPQKKEGIDLFDPENRFVSDEDIAHVLSAFVKKGINKNVTGSEVATKRLFANPYARFGSKKLIQEHGMARVEEVIEKLSRRINEKFCPKPKSPYTLETDWKRITEYLDDSKEKAIVKI